MSTVYTLSMGLFSGEMVDNSNMPHPKCLGSQKNPGTEPKTCERGPKLGFEYLPTSKTSHCVRTACMAFPLAPGNPPSVGLHVTLRYLGALRAWTGGGRGVRWPRAMDMGGTKGGRGVARGATQRLNDNHGDGSCLSLVTRVAWLHQRRIGRPHNGGGGNWVGLQLAALSWGKESPEGVGVKEVIGLTGTGFPPVTVAVVDCI